MRPWLRQRHDVWPSKPIGLNIATLHDKYSSFSQGKLEGKWFLVFRNPPLHHAFHKSVYLEVVAAICCNNRDGVIHACNHYHYDVKMYKYVCFIKVTALASTSVQHWFSLVVVLKLLVPNRSLHSLSARLWPPLALWMSQSQRFLCLRT